MTHRVALVNACAYPAPQGSQVLFRNTARALAARGHEVHLVVYGHGAASEDDGLTIHRCPRLPWISRLRSGPYPSKLVMDAMMTLTLRHVIRDYGIQFVHAHNYEGLMVALAAGKRPIVYHAHNAMVDELPHFLWPRTVARGLGSWLDTRLPKRADHVIALHERQAAYLVACGCSTEQTTVIGPPVELPYIPCDIKFGVLPGIVYCGNLDRYQNLGLLMSVIKRVRQVDHNAAFVVATSDQRHVEDVDVVRVTDEAGLLDVLSKDVIVVCPRVSWSGFPIKVLNAMALGRPVVVCESAGHGVTHRVNGLVAPDNDERCFADAILELMRDSELRRELGRRARETIEQSFTFDVAGKAMEQIYDSLPTAKKRART